MIHRSQGEPSLVMELLNFPYGTESARPLLGDPAKSDKSKEMLKSSGRLINSDWRGTREDRSSVPNGTQSRGDGHFDGRPSFRMEAVKGWNLPLLDSRKNITAIHGCLSDLPVEDVDPV